MTKNNQQTSTNNHFTWDGNTLSLAASGDWLNLAAAGVGSQCICTDTRKLKAGDVFLALKGDNFDGHDYLAKAQELGAVAAVVSQPNANLALPQLVVDDTRLALGRLGKYVRMQQPNLKVVALTGSSGKTTAKEMLGSILSGIAPTLITLGNLNNDLGVPMMLLELTDRHRFSVLELGANHAGEIAYTADLVKPDVTCVLNIGTAHIGEFGGQAAICAAKSEIFSALAQTGAAVLPSFDGYFKNLLEKAKRYTKHTLTFALDGLADVYASNITLDSLGSTFNLTIEGVTKPVTLSLAGKHNIANALAAAACAYALGVDVTNIAKGLELAKPAKGRLNKINFGRHILIDDTYNANPDAVLAAAQVLLGVKGQRGEHPFRVLVLGDIAELGERTAGIHAELGEHLKAHEPDVLICIGKLMAHTAKAAQDSGLVVKYFTNKVQAYNDIKNILIDKSEVAMLFKGSRTAGMETLIADIKQDVALGDYCQ